MTGPAVRFQLPPLSLFHFPPDPQPVAIPPPVYARTFASLFPISFEIYNAVLDWRVPVTIATLYATTALLLNRFNRSRNYKPWSISKTKSFHYFVLAHNIFLAVFSALTFLGMIRALAHTWPGRRDLEFFGKLWPGLRTTNGLAGAADSLCKLHGPKALGDAVFYNPDSHAWMTTNRHVKLSAHGTPETSDVGRLWNEGLAFWGWWFYLSKFYEVLDTFIILAKGKPSSTLQTYHHTGAMACMWAGIRYMSPPIWMFCFLNSGVHALMYTYYTVSALRIKVPQRVKSSLTTLQISQFIVGIAFASLHLFFHYSVPVSTPYTWTKTVSSVISAASAAATNAASGMASQASAVAEAPGLGLFLQKMLYRALGEEGLARRVGQQFKVKAPSVQQPHINVTEAIQRETRWQTQYMFIPCIDTEGQAFAIWLNVFYLAPLTLLFVQFFIRSYFSGGRGTSKPSKKANGTSKVSGEAARDASRPQEKSRKETENGSGRAAEKGSQRTGSNTPSRGGDRRRVSASIEQMVNNLEKTEAEAAERASKAHGGEYHESSRPSPGQKSKSTMNRSLFLESRDYVRSVDSSPKGDRVCRTKSSGVEHQDRFRYIEADGTQEEVEELERRAEASVRQAREAAGGQGARPVEEMDMSGERPERPTEACVVAEDKVFSNGHEDEGGNEEPSSNSSNHRPRTPLQNITVQNNTIQQPSHLQPRVSDILGIPPFPSPSHEPLPPSPPRSPSRIPTASSKPPISDLTSPVRRAVQPSRIPKLMSRSPTKHILTPATTTTSITTAAAETPALAESAEEGVAESTGARLLAH